MYSTLMGNNVKSTEHLLPFPECKIVSSGVLSMLLDCKDMRGEILSLSSKRMRNYLRLTSRRLRDWVSSYIEDPFPNAWLAWLQSEYGHLLHLCVINGWFLYRDMLQKLDRCLKTCTLSPFFRVLYHEFDINIKDLNRKVGAFIKKYNKGTKYREDNIVFDTPGPFGCSRQSHAFFCAFTFFKKSQLA